MIKFFKKSEEPPKDIAQLNDYIKMLEQKIDGLSEKIEDIKKANKFSVQKIGMVRFNPFKEVGSDQSFSVALLDGNDSGTVITSLYSRTENRIYAKPIENKQSKYLLSAEEKQAIEKAVSPKEENITQS